MDSTLISVMKSGEIEEIYAKWFTRPIPPGNASLNFPMPAAIKETYRNPNNRGI
ncbi:Glutamate/aspartate periplasmic-binding protein precursor [compost metagenome]